MKRTVVVNDRMQKGYVYYRTEPVGRNFAPGFIPQLTPKQMLELGVFGGKYVTDCRDEFPTSWFARAKLFAERHNPRLNYFGVNASQPLAEWRRKGWINPQDPRGWFQWYCRYYMGRRTRDDASQIRRWRAIARHVAAIRKHCEKETSSAGGVRGRHSCIGRMTAARSDVATDRRARPIRIGISACLLGHEVRFDGGHKRDTFLTETFGRFVDWVPVCPEVECGFGTPREAMRIVSGKERCAADHGQEPLSI